MTPRSAPFVDDTFRAIEEIEQSQDIKGIATALSSALSPFGFTAFAFAELPTPQPAILLNGWPDGWLSRYMEAGHYQHDPCAWHCRATSHPFRWCEIPPALREPRKSAQIFHEAAEFHFRDGLCVPLHTVHGLRGLSMAGERLELPAGASRMVQMLSIYACALAEGLLVLERAAAGVLTRRQREVLTWIAAGKSIQDVAEILVVSEHTVAEHLKAVRRKLGTSNAAHSVVEALRRGELSI
jgi:LuxR family quorum sensing-dependent transcriptional regulator